MKTYRILLGEKVYVGDNIQLTQDNVMESIHIQNLWSAELSVLELVSKARLSRFLD